MYHLTKPQTGVDRMVPDATYDRLTVDGRYPQPQPLASIMNLGISNGALGISGETTCSIRSMGPIYRKFNVRHIAEARHQSCYVQIFKVILENKIDYPVRRNGVDFNLTPLSDEVARRIDEILKRCEQRKHGS